MVGGSQVWKLALRQIVEAACYTQEPVPLTGETGTGKELAANLIHSLDARRSKYDLVVLDCTTIVPDLSGSELFGHERGAFTGAISARDGAFAVADRGVLFLDEVGELPLGLQVQLLRVLQERTYKRVGSNSWHATDFRLVCATNRDLQHEVMRGRFRRDLYYRLASWKIHLPPLSERKEDILPLVYHYLQDGQAEGNRLTLDQAVEAYLVSRSYPGNVRDLKNLTLRLKARSAGSGRITLGDIPYEDRPEQNREPEGKAVDPDTTQAVPQADAVGAPTVSSDTAIGQEQVVEFIRQVLASGSTWDEILQSFQSAAAQVAKEFTGGDEIAAGRRLGRDERTIKRWANGNRRNGKHGVNTDTQDG
jgi:transcriptional regulator with GAF, ATPase, and Fis domain